MLTCAGWQIWSAVVLQACRSGSDPLEAWAATAMAEVHSKCGRWEDSDAALQQAAALAAGAVLVVDCHTICVSVEMQPQCRLMCE